MTDLNGVLDALKSPGVRLANASGVVPKTPGYTLYTGLRRDGGNWGSGSPKIRGPCTSESPSRTWRIAV
jgi:hypothetical protein